LKGILTEELAVIRTVATSIVLFALLPVLLIAAEGDAPEAGRLSPGKYLRFQKGKTIAYGVLEGDRVRQLSGDLFHAPKKTEVTYALSDVTILVPTAPRNVLALAGNYRDHLGTVPVPAHPEPFLKLPSCLQRHEGPIVQPASTEPVHYEGELVIVIGRRARNVPESEALDYVLGVTCGNDVSARVWQKKDRQWWRAKASDTFGPCGPFIATGLNYDRLALELRVDGKVKQKADTSDMIHNCAQTVSFISQAMTLEPGDLIFTGTPGKTEGMKPGSVVEVEIEGVGILRNRVVAGDAQARAD
jgi:2-keto-4-pentenoate hydratase/2-oxohepta-3-ene-1,7-dioic acid hydratase in catechol pathway